MEDNRRQRRLPLSAGAKVTRLIGGETTEATVVDISCYGACLKTKHPLKTNDRIKVSITVTMDGQDLVMQSEDALATVRWVKSSAKDSSAGIMFNVKINDRGFPVFNQCIEHLKTMK